MSDGVQPWQTAAGRGPGLAPPAAPDPGPPAAAPQVFQGPSPLRRLADLVVLFFCAVVFLRAAAVEPFGVPTGSMAPTLIGNHRAAPCPRCDFPVRVGEPAPGAGDVYGSAHCPNCGAAVPRLAAAADTPGDRLLVDKNVFHLRAPRRLEVAVFHCPCDSDKPYVKRVVGLPGEEILLGQGDVYVGGRLARKTLADARAVRVLIFDQSYVPRPQGWRDRWVCERPEPAPGAAAAEGAEPPGGGAQVALRGGTLVVDATGLPAGYRQWVTYRNWDLDAGKEEVLRDEFVYNGPHRGAPRAVHDFLVECVLAAEAGDGRFALRLTDGRDRVTAELPVGQAPGPARLVREPGEVLATAEGARLAPGSRAEVTFALFDRRVLFSLDGEEVFGQVDLPEVPARAEVSRPLQLSAQGAAVAVEGLRLYRDVHYAPVGRHAVREPYRLPAGEYFVLGDNSGNSDDSRWWRTPGVPEESFLGKPFLLHQPSRTARWELFGEPRAVRVIDWGRVRWIR